MNSLLLGGALASAGISIGVGSYLTGRDTETKGLQFKKPMKSIQGDPGPNRAEQERSAKFKRHRRPRGRFGGRGKQGEEEPEPPEVSDEPEDVPQPPTSGGPSDEHPHTVKEDMEHSATHKGDHPVVGALEKSDQRREEFVRVRVPRPKKGEKLLPTSNESTNFVNLVQVSHASYLQELNKYNTNF